MILLFSPAKKMKEDNADFMPESLPVSLAKSQKILAYLQAKSESELQKIWGCSNKLVQENSLRLRKMDLQSSLSPALFAYEGIAFQYLAPDVLTEEALDYVRHHLRILSAFYGVLKPFDGVRAYRLELNNPCAIPPFKNLYEYWGSEIYEQLKKEKDPIWINLASLEYSRAVEKYLQNEQFIHCYFYDEINGKYVQKGVYAKMARGSMVRFLASQQAENPEIMKEFCEFGFHYCAKLSDTKNYIFVRQTKLH